LKSSIVDLIRSPFDGSPLKLEVSAGTESEVVTGVLRDGGGRCYPIIEGIPLFAEAESGDETFDCKWQRIGDSYGHEGATRRIRQQWYLDRFGFRDEAGLHGFLKDKKTILDAGCGSGVDSAMFAESGRTVVAVDLSRDAAQATYRHLGKWPNVHVLQADLCRLPFGGGAFDYISCDQVLHHTPDTAKSFVALARHLAPGGHLALYVYSRKAPIREFTDDYLRRRTTEMSNEECYEFSRQITLLGRALSELNAKVTLPEAVPLLGIPAGTHDVQRLIYWNVMKCFWNPEYDFETNVMINFDWYHPKFAWRHTPEEVRGWFEKAGLEVERLDVIPSGISAVGRLKEGK
jgi:SAM-dependent methyltransferase